MHIHFSEPELLILDEPTVGVDPVLRQSIWDHLVHITSSGKRTVIITTHYIEETRQAHVVCVKCIIIIYINKYPKSLYAIFYLYADWFDARWKISG